MPDLSLILSPFVYCAWGALRLWLPFILFLFSFHSSQERGPRGGPSPFFVVVLLDFLRSPQPLPSLLPGLKLQGLSPVPSLCLVYSSCLSSRLFLFAWCLHTFHFSFLTPGRGPAVGRRGGGVRPVTFLSLRVQSWELAPGSSAGEGRVEGPSRGASAAVPLHPVCAPRWQAPSRASWPRSLRSRP